MVHTLLLVRQIGILGAQNFSHLKSTVMGAQWKTKGKLETAAAKGKVFTKLAHAITLAARQGGASASALAALAVVPCRSPF